MIKLSVVVVLYNEFELAKKSLESVYAQEVPNMEIILVDNSSDTSGLDSLLKKFPKIKYVRPKRNLGFADGVNWGLKNSRGEYVLIFTPDMYLLPDTVKKTLNYIKKNAKIGLVGCRIYTSPKNQVQSAAHSYPNLWNQVFYFNIPIYKLIHRFFKDYAPNFYSKNDHKNTIYAKTLRGEYMLIREKAIEEVGYFDNNFFLYFEDFDFCRRLNNKGWKVVYLPIGGAVQNGLTKWKKTKITQALSPFLKSLYKFFLKYNGKIYTIVAWIIAFLSVLVAIPYLVFVVLVKSIFGKKSQSKELLPLWIDILKWHLIEGRKIVFTI